MSTPAESPKEQLKARLREFDGLVNSPTWHERPDGLAEEIRLEFDRPPFKLESVSEDAGGSRLHIEWTGHGESLSELASAFFRRYSRCYEGTDFIYQELREDCYLVQVAAGDPRHGHFIEVRVTGPGVDAVRAGHKRYMEKMMRDSAGRRGGLG